ncbi:MAG: TA0938 family protein [Thermoplasmata archaeon]
MPEASCALCNSEWGDHWEEVDGQRMFFCCWVCARAFDNVVQEVKRRTGWEALDEIKIDGDYRGRTCAAIRGAESYRFRLRFDPETGELLTFQPVAAV